MFTRAFWVAATERATKTAAQFALVVIGQDIVGWDQFQATLPNTAAAAALGAVSSYLFSLASAPIRAEGSPSLTPGAEVEAATHSPARTPDPEGI